MSFRDRCGPKALVTGVCTGTGEARLAARGEAESEAQLEGEP